MANFPALATADGNKNSMINKGLRGNWHSCHYFNKERGEEVKGSHVTDYQNRRQWWQQWQPPALTRCGTNLLAFHLAAGDTHNGLFV